MTPNQMWLLRDIIEEIIKKLPRDGGQPTDVRLRFTTPNECDLHEISKELNHACYKKELRQSFERVGGSREPRQSTIDG